MVSSEFDGFGETTLMQKALDDAKKRAKTEVIACTPWLLLLHTRKTYTHDACLALPVFPLFIFGSHHPPKHTWHVISLSALHDDDHDEKEHLNLHLLSHARLFVSADTRGHGIDCCMMEDA
jgi:hypothetical protein